MLHFVFAIFCSLLNSVFGLVFGQKYRRLVKKLRKVTNYSRKVFARDETKRDNARNTAYYRLDGLKEILAILQSQVVSLERQVDFLMARSPKRASNPAKDAPQPCDSIPVPPPPPCNSIPVPPPLPPPCSLIPVPPPPPCNSIPVLPQSPVFTCPAPSIAKRKNDKIILKAMRVQTEENAYPLDAKRSKPSSVDLIKGKARLRSTTVRRSPGGTPMSGWRVTEFDTSSPEDATISTIMKKALKRKFMNIAPFSPPSPIEASDGDEFSF